MLLTLRILRSYSQYLTWGAGGGQSWHRVVVLARQATWAGGPVRQPMITLSPSRDYEFGLYAYSHDPKKVTRRRITVTSSVNEISTDHLGNSVRRERGERPQGDDPLPPSSTHSEGRYKYF